MSSGEAGYKSAAVACTEACHLIMVIYDLRCMVSNIYYQDTATMDAARNIIDNETTVSISKCYKDTAGNRYTTRRHHYIQHGTALWEHKFEWIGTKF